LGPGLLESTYAKAMGIELEHRNIEFETEVPIRATYRGKDLGIGYRADIIVGDTVILELKSVEQIIPVHARQLLTYLRVSNRPVGMILNFNQKLMNDGVERVSNGARNL
jgi:GxxExxY protein